LEKHFKYIAIQNFYYKYRDQDEKYLQKCIDYCFTDTAMLPEIEKAYLQEDTAQIQSFAHVHGQKKLRTKWKTQLTKTYDFLFVDMKYYLVPFTIFSKTIASGILN